MLAERIGPSQLAELSAQGARLTSRVRPGELPRLAAVAAATGRGGGLDIEVALRKGPESFPIVDIQVRGSVPLTCQRCLRPVDCPVDLRVSLAAVPDEAAMDDLADPFDSVLLDADGSLRLRDAVEDEILATLPLAPLHADAADCGELPTAQAQAPGPQMQRPFAGLARLMGGPKADQE